VSYRIPPGLGTRRWADYRKAATGSYLLSLLWVTTDADDETLRELPAAVALAAHRDVTAFIGTNWSTLRLLDMPGWCPLDQYGPVDLGHDLAIGRVPRAGTWRGLWAELAAEQPRTFGLLHSAAVRFGPAALVRTDDGWAYRSAAKL
jgi:hypothetical protein